MRSSARLPSDRSQPHQRFDRAVLVHGGARLRDAVPFGLEVEDAAGIDATRQDVVEELRDVGARGRTAAAQPDVAGEHRAGPSWTPRFAEFSGSTFHELSARTGIPMDLLKVVREATGFTEPQPQDRVREDELSVVQTIELQLSKGFRPVVIERWLRVCADSLRRIAETE